MRRRIIGWLALAAFGSQTAAADGPALRPPNPARSSIIDWSGFYVGGHVGVVRGRVDATLNDPAMTNSSRSFGAPYGGIQFGYNHMLTTRWLFGVEVDFSFPNYLGADDVIWSRTTSTSDFAEQIDVSGTLRARLGYIAGRWMIYGTGGPAWSHGRYTQTPGVADTANKLVSTRIGWSAGGGVEYAFLSAWTARLEYLYSGFGDKNLTFPSGATYRSNFEMHALRVGLNHKLGVADGVKKASGAAPSVVDWEVHGQTTYIQQGYGSFRSPYLGTNSFTPWPQTRNTWTTGIYLGVRLWQGGELYYNPELLQGFGLHDTTGAGGYPNGEAQKSNFPYPHYNTSRLFYRHTFGFGGEQEKLASGPNQLSGKLDVSRLTIQVGKFSVLDVFDDNAYAKDPRKDFMNWSIWAPGAFDYPADRVGLTYGATAELNQRSWALRAGYFLIDSESNASNFDMRLFQRGGYVLELETRYSLWSRHGKFRTIGWINSAYSGSYRETLNNPGFNLDITQTRTGRIKYGYVFSVEQSITDDIGLFGRWSWNDGRSEIMAFTDIDSSLSFGTSIKGASWGRPNDTIGIGAALNALSNDHRDFVAAGGLGVLIGDGRLNYRQEKILETYYSFAANRYVSLTADYQLITNPAYNADRGPVSIFSGRLHARF